MNVVAYLRVSTEKQVDEGLGLDVQQQSIERWATAGGHTIVATFRDEGISGTKDADDRPGLAGALAELEDVADAMVVAKLDRLARSLTVQEAVLAHVWRANGRFFSVDVGEVLQDDPDDPMRTAMRQMYGVFAQLERGMIAARLRAGRRLKRDRGGYAGGAPRFGYNPEAKELVPDGDEQAAIARAIELRAEGRSLRAICRALDTEGHRPKRADAWHPNTLRRILDRLVASPAAA